MEQRVSVIGAGRLGLCWALAVERAGYHVMVVDVFPTYVDAINKRTLKSTEPQVMEMLSTARNLTATLSVAETVAFSKYIYIFVQTPSTGGDRHYDHTHVSEVLTQLSTLKAKDKHVIVCCTVMPGYCDMVAPALLSGCENVSVSYSPEFIAQGAIIAGLVKPDMVLIGEGCKEAGDHISALTLRYVTNCPPVHRMSAGSAEVAKLALNSFITLKIAFGNFIGDLSDAAERARKRAAPDDTTRDDKRKRIDKMQIARAIGADTRVGLKCLLPGYGFGGPCFPRDGRALASFASHVSHATCPVDAELAEAPGRANASHAHSQAQKLIASADAALRAGAAVATIVFDDVTFKPRCAVPIVLESQKLVVAKLVRNMSEHTVAIRSMRDDVIKAVQRDFGTLFQYWRLGEGTLPEYAPVGMEYIIADDELLPRDDDERKVYVPNNTKLEAIASGAVAYKPDEESIALAHAGAVPDGEQRGEGRSSLPTTFN